MMEFIYRFGAWAFAYCVARVTLATVDMIEGVKN